MEVSSEVNVFLTEAMGGCWHEWTECPKEEIKYNWGIGNYKQCAKCKIIRTSRLKKGIDFSTWKSFGILWEWAGKQAWWREFIQTVHDTTPHRRDMEVRWVEKVVDPARFATAVYDYLKEQE